MKISYSKLNYGKAVELKTFEEAKGNFFRINQDLDGSYFLTPVIHFNKNKNIWDKIIRG